MAQPPPHQPPLLVAVPDPPPPHGIPTTGILGRPGASALASYHRRRAAEWTLYQHTLPLRLAAVALVALLSGLTTQHAAQPSVGGPARWPPWWLAGGCGFASPGTLATGSGAPAGSGAPPASFAALSATAGSSSTT